MSKSGGKKKSKSGPPWPFIDYGASGNYPRERPTGWSTDSTSLWLFPLFLFDSELAVLELGSCRIRRLCQADIESMEATEKEAPLGLFSSVSSTQWKDFSDREWPWVIEVECLKTFFPDAGRLANAIRFAFEVTVRLYTNRSVFGSHPIVYQPDVQGSLTGQYTLSPSDPDLDEIPKDARVWINAKEYADLRILHRAAIRSKVGSTRIALRRFARGHGRDDDDAVIDLWIGLEAMFSDREGEITYKAAMRIAHYVGVLPSERTFLFRCLKRSYNVRSELVHGDDPKDTKPARIIALHCLRLSLIRSLAEDASPNIPGLDDAIAAGSNPA